MTVLCSMVLLGAIFMLAVGGLGFWPARDLEKSIESDREFIGRLSAGEVACSEEKLGSYASDTLAYHRSLKGAYRSMARAFLTCGGMFLVLGAWQLILVRRLTPRQADATPPGSRGHDDVP